MKWATKNRDELGRWLKWYRSCLASMRPRVQTPVPQKKKKKVETVPVQKTYCISHRKSNMSRYMPVIPVLRRIDLVCTRETLYQQTKKKMFC
jgi:hypothetical protein